MVFSVQVTLGVNKSVIATVIQHSFGICESISPLTPTGLVSYPAAFFIPKKAAGYEIAAGPYHCSVLN